MENEEKNHSIEIAIKFNFIGSDERVKRNMQNEMENNESISSLHYF